MSSVISWEELAILLSVPILAVIVHLLVNRIKLFASTPPQLIALASSLLASAVAVFCVAPGSLSVLLFCLLVSLGLSHVYFHLFNMSETARRIRILVSMKNGSLSVSAEERPIRVRLERLISLRQLRKDENDRLMAKPSLLLGISIVMVTYERILFPFRTKGSYTPFTVPSAP